MAGYAAPSYGYLKPQRPKPLAATPPSRSLAMAAAGPTPPVPFDPFGLAHPGTPQGVQAANTIRPTAGPATPRAIPTVAAPPPGSVAGGSGRTETAPVTQAYDINTDPAFAETLNLTGQSDEGAQAAALKAKSDLLLGYGDPTLAGAIGDPTLAQAAANNPTSTLAQLAHQRDTNTHDLTEGLNKANLLYSGYRVTQEQQAAEDYQNQLAAAAAAVNGNLGSIDSQLASALGSNQAQRLAAMRQAYQDHLLDTGPTIGPTLLGGGDGTKIGVPGGDAGSGLTNLAGTGAPNLDAVIAQLRKRSTGGGGGRTAVA